MSVIDLSTSPGMEQARASADEASLYGVSAEFDSVPAVLSAANALREQGYTRMDVHSPFPIHGIDDALGIKPTILPWLVLTMGLTGCFTGLVLTHYTMAGTIDLGHFVSLEGYRYLISGKPFTSTPGYIPVVFELTIMFAAYTAVFAMFLLNKLPQPFHPLFTSERFRRATQDRFFLAVEARDPHFDVGATSELLRQHGAVSVEAVQE
ncbi:MAG: DUF3341 domain-containing protein [Planctomycetota bacterium]